MQTLRTLGVAFVLCLSLVLSGLACLLIAMSMKTQQPPISDADVVLSGIGNSGNDITISSQRRLVRRVMERKVAPQVDDQTLRATVEALLERAKKGDVDAAAFVFELASEQRVKAPAGTATTTTATESDQ